MQTVVYPLTLQLDYTELKFSLRSIEKYLPEPYEVVIIGDFIPDWLINVTQIQLPDVKGRKQLSIKRKILAALEYADEILFLNDDVFLLKPAIEFPYYYHGELKTYPESGARPLYVQLQEQNKPVKHFDGHYPLIYKQDFREVVQKFKSDTIIKSMYANYLEIEGILIGDCKIMKKTPPDQIIQFIKNKPCFSTGEYSIKSALPILEEIFPNPSKYELY